ncbi:MAG: replication initiation protein [Arcicella sp.]|jgi:plasmid replication initiation protein|nr:replication initiation protein [Arcicella sp.]
MPRKRKTVPIVDSDIKLIRKANEFVEARYKFDIWETRVFAYMLTLIKPNDIDFTGYKINVGDIVREFSLNNSGKIYEELKKASEKLLSKKVQIERVTNEGITEILDTYLVISTARPKESTESYIKLSFHPDLKPFLLELKKRYLVYDIRNILSLSSVYSIRLFELLKQYQKIGKRKFRVDELKMLLSIEPNEYQLYGHFKEVIKRAEKELNDFTDIYFTFEEEIVKKKVISIIFYIYENPKNQRIKPKLEIETTAKEQESNSADIERIYAIVKKYVSKSKVKKWIEELPIEQIEKGINYTINYIQAGNKLKNIGGMLNSMVYTPNLFDKFQEEKQEQQKKVVKKEQEQKQREQEKQKEAETKRIKQEYEQTKAKTIKELFESQPSLAKEFLQELRTLRVSEKPNFFIELAHDNYKTNIEGIQADSTEEVLYNYELGGSFGAFLIDWIENKFPQYKDMKQQFEEQMKQR